MCVLAAGVCECVSVCVCVCLETPSKQEQAVLSVRRRSVLGSAGKLHDVACVCTFLFPPQRKFAEDAFPGLVGGSSRAAQTDVRPPETSLEI